MFSVFTFQKRKHFSIGRQGLIWCRTQMLTHSVDCFCRFIRLIHFFLSAFDSLDFYLVYIKVVPTCTDFVPLLIVRGLRKHYLHSKDYPISVDRRCHDGYTEIYRYDRRNYSLYRSLNSQCLKIEKVMRACVFYFLYFLQGEIKIFETRIILHFPHIMWNIFLP